MIKKTSTTVIRMSKACVINYFVVHIIFKKVIKTTKKVLTKKLY